MFQSARRGARAIVSLTLLLTLSASAEDEAGLHEEDGKISVAPLPIVFYTPETGTAFGVALNVFRRPRGAAEDARPSTITPLLIYTLKEQIVAVLSGQHYWDEEAQQIEAGVSYINFPDSFYGLGNDVDDEPAEDYTTENYSFDLGYLRRVRGPLRAGASAVAGHARILEREPGGLLDATVIPGSEGGTVLGAGVVLDRDSRDHISYPSQGSWSRLEFQVFDAALGSDYDFRALRLESRRYFGLGSDRVFALRGLIAHVDGEPPFQMLPSLGGDSLLRGYYGGRFRDRDLSAFEFEYRQLLRWRLGFAIFGGVGQVAHDPADFGIGEFHAAAGLGLRIQFLKSEKLNLRFDVGFAEDDGGSYISLGEAF